MIRDRIGNAALRAYPREVRRTRGPEMLSTLLDMGGRSKMAFARESGSLVLGGLRERAAITAQSGPGRLIADSCCQAGVIWSMLVAWQWLHLTAHMDIANLLLPTVVVWALLTCALAGYDRIAGFLGVCGTTAIIAIDALGDPLDLTNRLLLDIARVLVPLICFTVMAYAPRTRPRDARRLLWLLPIAMLAVVPYFPLGSVGFLAILSAYGLVRLAADPRLAIACGLVSATWALSWLAAGVVYHAPVLQAPSVLIVILAAPPMLMAGATRLAYLRRNTAR